MRKDYNILALNLGSTSTKVGFYLNGSISIRETVDYKGNNSAVAGEPLKIRKEDILSILKKNNINIKNDINLIVSRGGLMKPGPSGIYRISKIMCDDLLSGKYPGHPSAFGPVIAYEIGKESGTDAIVLDPPGTDEFHEIARYSGIKEIRRISAFHALSHKAAGRRTAAEMKRRYEEINLIVAHMGGGITIAAHERGLVIDSTHGLSEGPFTPERAGSLPVLELLDLIFVKDFSREEIRELLLRKGGLFSYSGTNDALEIEGRIRAGDSEAKTAYMAMAYQIAKEIGAMSAVLKGCVDRIVLTGGLARSKMLVTWIEKRVSFIAPVAVYPGEDEISALIDGGLRVLHKKEKVQKYSSVND